MTKNQQAEKRLTNRTSINGKISLVTPASPDSTDQHTTVVPPPTPAQLDTTEQVLSHTDKPVNITKQVLQQTNRPVTSQGEGHTETAQDSSCLQTESTTANPSDDENAPDYQSVTITDIPKQKSTADRVRNS